MQTQIQQTKIVDSLSESLKSEQEAKKISIVVEYDEATELFHLVKKPFKNGEEKVLCLSSNLGDKMAVEAAYVALSKSTKWAVISSVDRFFWPFESFRE